MRRWPRCAGKPYTRCPHAERVAVVGRALLERAEVSEVSEKLCVVAPYLKALRWSIGSLAPIPSLSDQLPSPCHFAASRGHDLRGGRCVTPRVDITCRYSENTNEGRSLAPRLPPAHHQPVSSEPYLRRRGGMMVVSGDVAISGRASGSSGATRAYPPWTKRPTPSVPDRVRVC